LRLASTPAKKKVQWKGKLDHATGMRKCESRIARPTMTRSTKAVMQGETSQC